MTSVPDAFPKSLATPDAAAARPEERRQAPRGRCSAVVFLCRRPDPDATYEVVSVLDVAAGGLGLFLSRPVRPGTACYLQFGHLAVRDRVATVVHATEVDGGWHIGCALDSPLDPPERRALRV